MAAFTFPTGALGLIVADGDRPELVNVDQGVSTPILYQSITNRTARVLRMASGKILFTIHRKDLRINLFEIDEKGVLKIVKEGFRPMYQARFDEAKDTVEPYEGTDGKPKVLQTFMWNDSYRSGTAGIFEIDPLTDHFKDLGKDFTAKKLNPFMTKNDLLNQKLSVTPDTLIISKQHDTYEIRDGLQLPMTATKFAIRDEDTGTFEVSKLAHPFEFSSTTQILKAGKKNLLINLPIGGRGSIFIAELDQPSSISIPIDSLNLRVFKHVLTTIDQRIEAVYAVEGGYKVIQLYGPSGPAQAPEVRP